MSARRPYLPLEDSSSLWIIRMAQAVDRLHKWYLETYQLTRTQIWALLAIRHHADRPAKVATTLGVSPAAATKLIDQLSRAGYVRRSRAGGDRRILHVELTDKAEAALPSLQSAAHSADRLLVRGLQPGEIRTLIAAARRIIENAKELGPPDEPEGAD